MLAETQRDLTAEQAAERLRAVSNVHFRESGCNDESERKPKPCSLTPSATRPAMSFKRQAAST
nr:hypothetical protein [Klebsiella pneumoniae subsp. pneumoniae]